MSLQEQTDTRQMLRDLKATPLNVLQNNGVRVDALNGADTQASRLFFGYLNNEIRIGDRQFAGIFMGAAHPDAVVATYALASPMRAQGAAGRLNATARFVPGNNDLWVTEQQSGCSVLILDWGANQYSMVHLQQHADNDFSSVSQTAMNQSDAVKAVYKNAWLRPDLTTVVNASVAGGVHPNRYILVQSLFNTLVRGTLTQLIGVRSGGGWDFFQQTYQVAAMGNLQNVQVRQLAWTTWWSHIPYQSY
jgi:hypothetical protein